MPGYGMTRTPRSKPWQRDAFAPTSKTLELQRKGVPENAA
jgi:hypothetical protein